VPNDGQGVPGCEQPVFSPASRRRGGGRSNFNEARRFPSGTRSERTGHRSC